MITFESWYKIRTSVLKSKLSSSLQDLKKYLELDTLVREKNEVLSKLTHLPILVRGSMRNSILLSELQFNLLNNFEVVKKVITTSGKRGMTAAMVTKLEIGIHDNSLYVGGNGSFISKYSLETRKLLLATQKCRLE